ncbi:MAG TPA: hypothetical protein ENM99_00285 [Desulfurella acetivorans]|uniref:Uncharacterized protein n=1 Tax=Desulfurella acetivorans TaxID=33002 RepID=A0A7C6E7F7_DESAE|nr:hypothetical protein [Desulfurella acetivorans]
MHAKCMLIVKKRNDLNG